MFAKIAGGACMIGSNDVFNIGQRNVQKVKSLLAAASIPLTAEDTGSTISRTVAAPVFSGEIEISSPGVPVRKI